MIVKSVIIAKPVIILMIVFSCRQKHDNVILDFVKLAQMDVYGSWSSIP